MSRKKFKFSAGDTVQVIAGGDKGKKGKVLKILADSDRALVEGLNMKKKHQRGTQDNPDGGIIELEGPIHVSNLKAVAAAKEAN